MKLIYTIISFLLFSLSNLSAQVEGQLTSLEGLPLIGANILWQGTSIGTTSDAEGKFSISDKGIENRTLVISYIGFNTEILAVGDIKYWEIQLLEDYTLSEIEVVSQNKATRYADAAAKIEVIGAREIERAACCSLAGCFSTNASVSSATTNVVTNAKELRILGLSGVYNQVLFDGVPLVQGLAYTYGASSYPGTMIESIFVSKGSNSVLQGYESISGQINIIPHKPENAPRLYLNAFANSFGESQYNINHMLVRRKWSNFTTAHLTLPARRLDRDGDGFRDIVRTQRISLFNKWIYDNPDNDRWRTQIGLRFWKEAREGGTVDYSRKEDLGSPDQYGQAVDLQQFDVYGKLNFKVNNQWSLIWLNSAFFHQQDSYYGLKRYEAEQSNFTSNLYGDWYYGDAGHNLKLGSSWRHNRMKEDISFVQDIDFLTYDGIYRSDYDVPGFFAENKFQLKPFTIIAGIRSDYHGAWGWKVAPRFLLRAELPQETDLRFSIGKGFRRVHIFPERINLLASNRDIIFEEALAPEEALNVGINAIKNYHLDNINITLSADAYYTFFQNQVFPDYDRSVGKAYISNFYGQSASQSFQFENKWEFYERVDFKWAYNYLHVYRMEEGVKEELPFVAKHKLLLNTSYTSQNDEWQIDATVEWFGRKRLPDTQAYPLEYRQPGESNAFSRLDLQLTRRWPKFEIYGGVENILDFRQEFPILAYDAPYGPYFDTAFNWGPTKGREFFLGLRFRVAQKPPSH